MCVTLANRLCSIPGLLEILPWIRISMNQSVLRSRRILPKASGSKRLTPQQWFVTWGVSSWAQVMRDPVQTLYPVRAGPICCCRRITCSMERLIVREAAPRTSIATQALCPTAHNIAAHSAGCDLCTCFTYLSNRSQWLSSFNLLVEPVAPPPPLSGEEYSVIPTSRLQGEQACAPWQGRN